MADIVNITEFEALRSPRRQSNESAGPAECQVIFFTGVRYDFTEIAVPVAGQGRVEAKPN